MRSKAIFLFILCLLGTIFVSIAQANEIYHWDQNRQNKRNDPSIEINDRLANIRYLNFLWSRWSMVPIIGEANSNRVQYIFEETKDFFKKLDTKKLEHLFYQSRNRNARLKEAVNITFYNSAYTYSTSKYSDVGVADVLEFRNLAGKIVNTLMNLESGGFKGVESLVELLILLQSKRGFLLLTMNEVFLYRLSNADFNASFEKYINDIKDTERLLALDRIYSEYDNFLSSYSKKSKEAVGFKFFEKDFKQIKKNKNNFACRGIFI